MLPNWATLSYLVAIVLFIIGIKQLTSPATARACVGQAQSSTLPPK